jgi:hypothetical protein
MLSILGQPQTPFCDGQSRRHFLQIGTLGLGGLTLPQILRAEDVAPQGATTLSHKAIIMIYLAGGPSHQDMYDLKMDAPVEIRGEFKPIKTNVSGIEICEYLPRLAAMMDKLAIIRSLCGAVDQHTACMCVSGWPMSASEVRQSGHPALGSVLSKLQGPVDRAVPPFVGFAPNSGIGGNGGEPGFLGAGHAPFRPVVGNGLADMKLKGISLSQLADRRSLLTSFDRFRRDLDVRGMVAGMDAFEQRAFDVLTSSKLVEALDLGKEDPRLRDRYGRGDPGHHPAYAPYYMDQFLMARRLVEVGVRCVTVAFGLWDTHSDNFSDKEGHGMKYSLPRLDQGVSALVQDLHDRGLQNDVSVVVWGEFGRTPRIDQGGRHHWPHVSCALLAGGGMRMGQVIGSTNRLGEVPHDRPVHYQDVFATLYRQLGINVRTTIPDHSGRPQYLLDRQEPIPELV